MSETEREAGRKYYISAMSFVKIGFYLLGLWVATVLTFSFPIYDILMSGTWAILDYVICS